MNDKKTILIDIDGTICNQTEGDYENSVPNKIAIAKINNWYAEGHTIIFYTSRFMGRCKNNAEEVYRIGYEFTKKQLKSWGVKFHELIMGKPKADLIIDDRTAFFNHDWENLDFLVKNNSDKK